MKAQAHHLSPVVVIGKEGLVEGVLGAVTRALLDHELIKIRVLESAPLERQEAASALADGTGAQLVSQLGRIVCLYKRHPEKPGLVLPSDR